MCSTVCGGLPGARPAVLEGAPFCGCHRAGALLPEPGRKELLGPDEGQRGDRLSCQGVLAPGKPSGPRGRGLLQGEKETR